MYVCVVSDPLFSFTRDSCSARTKASTPGRWSPTCTQTHRYRQPNTHKRTPKPT